MRTRLILIICFVFLTGVVQAQQVKTFKLEKSQLLVQGTSSLHDWEMKVLDVSCIASLIIEEKNLLSFKSVNFKCISTSLKSENSIMDNKTYDALRAKKHSEITFVLNMGDIADASIDNFKATLMGTLTLAGVSREIQFPVYGKMNGDEQFDVKGNVAMKMSDFKIKPPTAVFGTIKTGDVITLEYDFTFKQMNNQALTDNN